MVGSYGTVSMWFCIRLYIYLLYALPALHETQ